MASYRKLESGLWQATVRLPGGKRTTRTNKLKGVVRDWAVGVEAEMQRARWGDPRESQMLFGVWLDKYLATRSVSPESARGDRTALKHIRPHLDHLHLSEIRPSTLQAWQKTLTDGGLGAPGRRKAFVLVRLALQQAALDELIPYNPASAVAAPKPRASLVDWYERDEVEGIMAALITLGKPGHAAMVAVMAWCGLRWGECAGLRVGDIRWTRSRIRIIGSLSQHGDWLEYPKNVPSRREIPAPPHVLGLLVPIGVGRPDDELLFLTARGSRPHNGANWREIFDKAKALADIGRGTPHTLRHTCASWLVQAGVPLMDVGKLLGHATPASTAIYAHLVPDAHSAVELGWAKILGLEPGAFRASPVRQDDDQTET